jgi:protein gp37
MSDLFHPEIADEYIMAVAAVMAMANWHTYQVLTKRAERQRELLNGKMAFAAGQKHIWWGVSVEDQKYGLPRLDQLKQARAAVKFASIEPLLEDLGEFSLRGIDWAIVGGESGAGARKMEECWVQSIREKCARDSVAFFFKQWGGVHKKKTGRLLNGREYNEYPDARSRNAAPDRPALVDLRVVAAAMPEIATFVQ